MADGIIYSYRVKLAVGICVHRIAGLLQRKSSAL